MEFVTITESSNMSDLLVLKSLLEANGIQCFLKDELSAQILNFLPLMSVKLQVHRTDVPRVKEILKNAGESQNEKE